MNIIIRFLIIFGSFTISYYLVIKTPKKYLKYIAIIGILLTFFSVAAVKIDSLWEFALPTIASILGIAAGIYIKHPEYLPWD